MIGKSLAAGRNQPVQKRDIGREDAGDAGKRRKFRFQPWDMFGKSGLLRSHLVLKRGEEDTTVNVSIAGRRKK